MTAIYRAFDRRNQYMIYNVVSDSDNTIIGRIEGTEQWVKRLKVDLVFQRGTKQHDICLKPVYEADVLRNEEGNRYRVEYQRKSDTWMLFDIDEQIYSPFQNISNYQVITHTYGLIVDLKTAEESPFPNPVETPHRVNESQPEALLPFEVKPFINTSTHKNQDDSGSSSIARTEAIEIPFFMDQRTRTRKSFG